MIRWIGELSQVSGLDVAWVWTVRLDSAEAHRALAAIPARPEDLADAAALPAPDAGARRLIRRRLLRGMVALAQGVGVERVRLARGPFGAPLAEGAHISAAARGDWAVLAVSPAPVGVDLELADGEAPPPIEGFAPSERSLIAGAADPSSALWSAWVAKEAWAKAAGDSLDEALSAVQVISFVPGEVVLRHGHQVQRAALRATEGRVLAALVLDLACPHRAHGGALPKQTPKAIFSTF